MGLLVSGVEASILMALVILVPIAQLTMLFPNHATLIGYRDETISARGVAFATSIDTPLIPKKNYPGRAKGRKRRRVGNIPLGEDPLDLRVCGGAHGMMTTAAGQSLGIISFSSVFGSFILY